MNAKAASAIRFAIALAFKEQYVFETTKRFPITAYYDSMANSDARVVFEIPRKYQRLAHRALARTRQALMARYTQNLLTKSARAYYDVYNEHHDREN